MNYCPFCGFQIDPNSIYCGNCGKNLPQTVTPSEEKPKSWQSHPLPSSYKIPAQKTMTYQQLIPTYTYRKDLKASFGERFIALLIDSCIVGGLSFAFCLGWLYQLLKDGVREGQSFGKDIMALRVVDFNTGMPATIGQSFVRNCLCGCVDAACCYLVAFIDEDGRRLGDHVAGTVVIIDQ